MTARVEKADFDCNLFGNHVGRLELSDDDAEKITLGESKYVLDELHAAHEAGYKLIYLMTPNYNPKNLSLLNDLENSLFGETVDYKMTYRAPLEFFSKHHLQNQSPSRRNTAGAIKSNENISNIRIEPHPYNPALEVQPVSPELRALALASGEYSRFKVDDRVPDTVFDQLFSAWIQNSVNRTLAHETFVAIDSETNLHVGMITLKQKGEALIDVGLLAVAPTYRRKGIASMLLSKAALWSLDRIGHLTDTHNPTLQVVTQRANQTACKTYEKYGFTASSVQIVNHVWLPDDLENVPMPVRDLAPIPYCRQHLTGNENNYIREILDGRLLDSASKYTTLCSAKLKKFLNSHDRIDSSGSSEMTSEHVVVTSSGTAALEMAAILCNIRAGDEVIMPSYTFSSTANAFVLRGGVPVFVDVREDTLNIDESLIEKAITSKTKAICCVHYAGTPCEMDTIMEIASRHSLYVVEDAAQAFLSTYKGRRAGSIGHFGCFSFHYTKNIICGEGGALSVNVSKEMVRKALILWEKGTNRCDFMSGKVDKYEWLDLGSSYVPSEINCAILYAQLEQCEDITKRRLRNFEFYQESLSGITSSKPGVSFRLPKVPPGVLNNAHIFYIILPSVQVRDIFQQKMKERGVAVFSHYVPLHSSPAGIKFGRVGEGSEDMRVTNAIYEGLVRLPVWVGLEDEDLKTVVNAVHVVIQELL